MTGQKKQGQEKTWQGQDSKAPGGGIGDFLPLDLWDDIVDLLVLYNEVHPIRASWAHRLSMVCVDLAWIGSGDVFPRGASSDTRSTFAIARVNQNHFVPLFRLHDRNSR